MIIVHHLENSRSQRVLWLLEELGVPYQVERYERDPVTMQAPKALRDIHPLGKSPVITDAGVVVAETGAIVEYLVETYGEGRLIPKAGTPEKRAYTYWLHYAEGSAMPPMLLRFVFLRIPMAVPGLIRPIVKAVSKGALDGFVDPQIRNQLEWCEQSLSKTSWFAGPDFTAADVMMSYPTEVAEARFDVTAYPHVAAFVHAIHARPAYQRALERGGPYGVPG